MSAPTKGKIAVLIEDHFDPGEFREFAPYFAARGYEVVFASHLWGQPALHFGSNPEDNVVREKVTVTTEVNAIDLNEYAGVIAIGAYATDRLRYQSTVRKGQKNASPAVAFLRRATATPHVVLGAICHGLWLWCADRDLIAGKKVTCSHNILCDVENAGGDVQYAGDGTADLVVDGNLVTGKHPEVNDKFMAAFADELDRRAGERAALTAGAGAGR